jgi:magnesium chelatase family protein
VDGMQGKVHSAVLCGIEAIPVQIEVDVAGGMPSCTMVGLPDTAVRESKLRVRSALKSCGYKYPDGAITINLAPAWIRKEGVAFDLPVALGLLAACGSQIPVETIREFLVVGELSLNGKVRPVRGILSMASAAARSRTRKLLVPAENAAEAAVVEDVEVYPVDSLPQAVEFFNSRLAVMPFRRGRGFIAGEVAEPLVDFRDVKGQMFARRAIEIAAAGGHHAILIGPPGSGKTMISRRIPGILPEMTLEEAIETTKIYSVAGYLDAHTGLLHERPFRSPHHTTSDIGLIGGGVNARPGEISLAHNGVLFLDELPEFRRHVLETLRQPLEDGHVTISRAGYRVRFPSDFVLVAAMNPCPCGFFGSAIKACSCALQSIERYRSRISGPLLDRFDIQIEVPAVPYRELAATPPAEASREMMQRVNKARECQRRRYLGSGMKTNADLKGKYLRQFCQLDRESGKILEAAVSRFGLSARAYDKVRRVARTIADLNDEPVITPPAVAEAVQYRAFEKEYFAR